MKSFFIFTNGFYFCEDKAQSASMFNTNIYRSSFIAGTRILFICTDKGWYKINLEKENFTIFNHIDNWWISGVPYIELQKGDLP